MKKLFILFASVVLLASCEREKKNLCPVVAATNVPNAVTKSFESKYPGTTVTTWFNKDNTSYCAKFTQNGKGSRAYFDNNGIFQNEQLEQDGEHQDNNDEGCDCETDDGEHGDHH